ncbi:aminofutalosine synthase MqnE [Acetohalobium arabaticum]|uniref:Aminodeoxyfutalosine synthase n=1 Tax=Acetohalobium arabaticum (strain ATCC 49924 / DSM 5501 / Z-7288) TaxID=574087 RepID=D9QUZ4_ACEAZ|nr:aminofutalosine synthase MqnE [Acetohalobium arabaticum]ADL12053.1 Radical SAM domain protein [Acetohalobium arabaticum DSM 5501]
MVNELFSDSELEEIGDKVLAGERLTREDGIKLMKSNDLLTIGYLADYRRQEKCGDEVYYIKNRHINHTNVCEVQCRFCAFGREEDEDGAYTMELNEIAEAIDKSPDGISELHIVGGCHHDLSLEYFEEMLRLAKDKLPEVYIQAFTVVEIAHLADKSGLTVKETLKRLKQAGLDSIPGGGAEVFSPRVREKVCKDKVSGERWLSVMETAHNLGIKTNATMLYGHVETPEERIDHLIKLRELQDKTEGFLTFIPLAFHPENTELNYLSATTGYDDLKVLAIARLMLDNFAHIKAFWIMLGTKLAQISLSFGVDDLDGTVVEEKITHDAGAQTKQGLTEAEIVNMIKEAGRIPVERDTVYNRVGDVK